MFGTNASCSFLYPVRATVLYIDVLTKRLYSAAPIKNSLQYSSSIALVDLTIMLVVNCCDRLDVMDALEQPRQTRFSLFIDKHECLQSNQRHVPERQISNMFQRQFLALGSALHSDGCWFNRSINHPKRTSLSPIVLGA
jgi:hypothetical protein